MNRILDMAPLRSFVAVAEHGGFMRATAVLLSVLLGSGCDIIHRNNYHPLATHVPHTTSRQSTVAADD